MSSKTVILAFAAMLALALAVASTFIFSGVPPVGPVNPRSANNSGTSADAAASANTPGQFNIIPIGNAGAFTLGLSGATELTIHSGPPAATSRELQQSHIIITLPPRASVVDGLMMTNTRTFTVDVSRLRAALQLLSQGEFTPVKSVSDAEREKEISEFRAVHTLSVSGSRDVATLEFGSVAVGGNVKVRLTRWGAAQQLVTVRSDLAALFKPESVLLWRQVRPLTAHVSTARSLSITMPAGTLELSRTANRWSILKPIAATADEQTVRALSLALSSVTIADFLDQRDALSLTEMFAKPQATIEVTSDQIAPGQPPTQIILTIGAGPADAARRTLYCKVLWQGFGNNDRSLICTIEAAALLGLGVDATPFLSRTSLPVPAADISRITVQPNIMPAAASVSFTRGLEGWLELRADGAEVLLPKERAQDVLDSLALFAASSAEQVSLAPPPQVVLIGTVQLADRAGQMLAEFFIEVGTLPGGKPAVLLRQNREPAVYRAYAKLPPLLEFLMRDALQPTSPEQPK